ncbi:hypothetical protein [Tissierella sp. Yu-01]|uniref:hypothetical protein n=1 Tax=Tissierella sp. Yu-01 TaxID=3035694 RepID=UPI00240DF3ED|nr:hypothetical protein [Tissierella sp. Yu-01]WFA08560.1 hypothetical protein P3962_12640 [Tissierella sp. Yu-01]
MFCTKSKKAKSKLGVIALTLAVILSLNFFSKGYITYATSPELSVKLAAKETIDNITKDYHTIESLLFGNIDWYKSHYINMSLSIEDASHTDELVSQDLHLLKGMGIDIASVFDDAKKELIFNGKYQIGGEDLISLMLKLDDEELQITIPELFEKVLSVPSKNYGEEWNKSIYGQEIGEIDNNLDLSITNLQKNSKEIDDETKNAYMNALNLIFKGAKYETAGTTTLKIGNDHKEANITLITLEEKNVKDGVIALYDAVKLDNSIDHWTDETIEAMQEYVREYFKMDSLTINVFTYNGNIVKSEIEIVADKDSEDGTLFCTIELLGEKSLMDDFRFELEVADEKFTWETKGNHTGNDNKFLSTTKITMISPEGEEFIGEFSTEIDLQKKNDNFKANINFKVDGEEMNLVTLGDYNLFGDSLEFKSNDINFTFRDYNDSILKMTFKTNLKTGTDITNKQDFRNYDKVELFKMDESQLDEFIYLIEENAYTLGEKFTEHLGY